MAHLHISLSERDCSLLRQAAASRGHLRAEDYAASVIQAELRAQARERLEAQLREDLEGEAAGRTRPPGSAH